MRTFLTLKRNRGLSILKFNCDKCETEIVHHFTNKGLLSLMFAINYCQCPVCGKKYEYHFEIPIEITEEK